MSNEKFKPPYTANKSLSLKLAWMNNFRKRLEFKESSLKQEDKAPFAPKNVVNLFIVYEFGNVKIIKNADSDKYSYSGYGTVFNSRSLFSTPNFDWGKNSITFGVDMSSPVHNDKKNKDILILGKRPTPGLYNITLTAEAEYSINFLRSQRKSCLSLHYNESISFLFVNTIKIYQFKPKNSEVTPYPLCLGNISMDFTANNMTKQD